MLRVNTPLSASSSRSQGVVGESGSRQWETLAAWWAQAGAQVDRALSERRVRGYSWLLLVVWMASLAVSIGLGQPPRNAFGQAILPDYLAHWTGGRLLLEGAADRLYDGPTQQLLQDQTVGPSDKLSWYVNPPFTALFYLPLAALPYLPSALVWTVLSLGLLLLSAHLLRPLVPGLGRAHWRLVLLAAAATPPLYELIGSGQDSALSLVLWVA